MMIQRGMTALLGAATLALALGTMAPATARADSGERLTDREQIANLIYCYARGTDAIGDATTNADPLAKGISIYTPCMTSDAEIRAWFPQQPFDSQTFPNPAANPATAPPAFYGPSAWAQFVNTVFRGNGYTFTQHMMTNVDVRVHGNTGQLTAYLNASHVRSGSAIGGPSRCVAVANGTYSADVRKFGDTWKITRMYLTLITFNPVFQSGAGC
jgi:hypothetical protein